ncbi:MAG: hypothetical protein COA79_17020 [Planctomycetota bacterium]|nr:MAG: hypothetical protein COA79_17020 [Planctomycetota bacterium]
MKNPPGFKHHLNILIERNIALLLNSSGTILFLLLPAFTGWLISLAFHESDKPTYFILTFSVIFIGCMNTSCEIVRERTILERERMFSLSLTAYVLSKTLVMAVISIIQIVILLFVVTRSLHLSGNIILLFIFLFITCIAGNGLGLVISTFAKSSKSAVVSIPFLIIPQIIFSELVLGSQKKYSETIQSFTLSKWCYQALENISKKGADLDWSILGASFAILLVSSLVFLMISVMKLRIDEY